MAIQCLFHAPAIPFDHFGVGFGLQEFKKYLILLATPAGFEPATLSLEDRVHEPMQAALSRLGMILA